MDENGRLCDVLINNKNTSDPRTGLESFSHLEVRADEGMKKLIESVPGVSYVFVLKNRYDVFLDPRYDREWIKAEIEAKIKIGE